MWIIDDVKARQKQALVYNKSSYWYDYSFSVLINHWSSSNDAPLFGKNLFVFKFVKIHIRLTTWAYDSLSIYWQVLIFATVLVGWSSSQTICPDSSIVSPCICSDNNDGLTTQLNCFGRNVNDAKLSDILDFFLAPTSRANPLGYVNLGANPLTQVPYQLPYFRELRTIGLGSNSITDIKHKAFSYNRLCDLLDLRINSINTIAAGAFQGAFGNSSYIYLSGNSLTRVDAGVFQNVAQKMISTGGGYPNGYIWLKDSNYKTA